MDMGPKEIADKLGVQLKEEPDLDRLMKYDSRNTYACDENGKVIGLNIRGNELVDRKVALAWELRELQVLNLSENQLTSIAIPKGMKALRHLKINENKTLKSLTFEAGLPALEKLEVSECGLAELSLPPGFDSLQAVHAQQNKLNRFGAAGNCPCLKYLDLAGNQLQAFSLPGSLPHLEILYLQGGNKVKDISFLAGAGALQTLNLSGNAVQDLSPVQHLLDKRVPFKWKSSGNGVLVEDCPLTTPAPEIVKEGNDTIARYFEELKKGVAFLYEAKVLLVGESEVGKTSLLRKLRDQNAELPKKADRTRGIDIIRLPFKNRDGQEIFMNIWDFGGQQIYHATHRFFLTHRSLYVLLADTSRQEDNFDYWIPSINLFGGDSPILAIKNKKYDYDREITIARFVEKFNIQARVIPVNLLTTEGLPQLRDNIYFNVEQLPVIGSELPASWVQVRKDLEKLAGEKNYIEYFEFKQLCKRRGIEEEIKIKDLGKYFHDLGVILWYHGLGSLKNKVILVPQWATNAVYKIIDDKTIQEQKGHFDKKDIERLWEEEQYREMHSELLALMEAFKLCYQKKNGKGYIIPSMLPADPPGLSWDYSNNLCLEYEYVFMPKGIVNQLTAQLSELIPEDELVWGRGVFLKDQLSKARVEEDWVKRTIFVNTRGVDARSLMRIIMMELENIHKTYPGIQFTKKVPCPCEACSAETTPNFFNYNKLIERLESGKRQIYCNDGDAFVDIENILLKVGIEMPMGHARGSIDPTPVPQPKALKAFISYSQEDAKYLKSLKKQLAVLKWQDVLLSWDDTRLLPGEKWDDKIKEELASANLILMLVSPDSLSTEYIWNTEMEAALKRQERGEALIVPIIVRPCLWEGAPFADYTVLPAKGEPITSSSWTDQDEAWKSVALKLKELVEKINK